MIDTAASRRHSLWLAMISLTAFALSQRSVALALTGVLVALASWLLTDRCTRRMLPPAAVLVAVVIITAAAASQVWPRFDPARLPRWIGMGVFFGMLVRLWCRRTISDERQIVLLSGVLLVAAGLHSIDLTVGLLIIAGTALAVDSVVRFRLLTQKALARCITVATAARRRDPTPAERDLRRVIGVASVLCVIASAAIFVALPRNPNPGGPLFGGGRGSRMGFPEEITLRTPAWLEPGDRELLSVEWLGPDGKPPAVAETLRLRGKVLDRYDPATQRWVARTSPSQRFLINDGIEPSQLSRTAIDERINTCTLRVNFRGLYTDTIFAPWVPVSVQGQTAQVFGYAPDGCTLRLVDLETAGIVRGYQARIQPFPSESVLTALQGGPQRVQPAPTFPIDPVRATALEWLARAHIDDAGGPPASDERWSRNIRLARAFEDELRSARFTYTLDLRTFVQIDGRDPIDLFLNEHRIGHCEYFASALCALCQSVGVDARIVTGFIVHEYDATDRRYSVREADAHAWVEVRSGPVQWTVFDPTPVGEDTAMASERALWAQVLRLLLGPLEDAWRERIERFDSIAQESFLRAANERIAAWVRYARQGPALMAAAIAEWTGIPEAGIVWIASVGVFVLGSAAAGVLIAHRLARRRRLLGISRRGRMRARIALRDGAFYADALALLAQSGLHRPPWQAPRAFASGVSSRHAQAGAVFAEIVDRYYRIRFAGKRPGARERAGDADLVRRLRAALAAGARRDRGARGAAHAPH